MVQFEQEWYEFLNSTWVKHQPSIASKTVQLQSQFMLEMDQSDIFLQYTPSQIYSATGTTEVFTLLGEIHALMETSGTATIGEYAQALQAKSSIPKFTQSFDIFGKWLGGLLIFVAVAACSLVAYKCCEKNRQHRRWSPPNSRRYAPRVSFASTGSHTQEKAGSANFPLQREQASSDIICLVVPEVSARQPSNGVVVTKKVADEVRIQMVPFGTVG